MKHIICILGGYAPFYSPGGKIADNVLQELKKKYKITVIARKDRFGLKDDEYIDGIHVIRLNEYNQMFHSLFESKAKSANTLFEKYFYLLLLRIKQIINYLIRLCRRVNVSRTYVIRVKKTIQKINLKDKVDILMPIAEPHEATIAAYELKKSSLRDIMLVPYQLDFFASGNSMYENKFIRKIRYPIHWNLESKILEAATAVFALPPIYNYYQKSGHNEELIKKVILTEHPLLKRREILTKKVNNKIVVVYAGSLDKTLRNPEYLFKTLEGFKNKKLVQFDLYSFGNCQSIIDEYVAKNSEMIFDHGKIPSKELDQVLAYSDIIVTIGNNSSNEVPSKLFDLLSFGKPIVHFYYNENDAYIHYLSKYNNSICLKMDEILLEENSEKFENFCDTYKGISLQFNTVQSFFENCTPAYVAGQFENILRHKES